MFSIVDCPNKSYPVGHLRTRPIVYVHSHFCSHTRSHTSMITLQNFTQTNALRVSFECETSHFGIFHHHPHHRHFSCFFIAAAAVCHCTLGQLVQMWIDYSLCSVEKQSIRKHANELEVMVLSRIHITLTQHTQNTNASNTSSIE